MAFNCSESKTKNFGRGCDSGVGIENNAWYCTIDDIEIGSKNLKTDSLIVLEGQATGIDTYDTTPFKLKAGKFLRKLQSFKNSVAPSSTTELGNYVKHRHACNITFWEQDEAALEVINLLAKTRIVVIVEKKSDIPGSTAKFQVYGFGNGMDCNITYDINNADTSSYPTAECVSGDDGLESVVVNLIQVVDTTLTTPAYTEFDTRHWINSLTETVTTSSASASSVQLSAKTATKETK